MSSATLRALFCSVALVCGACTTMGPAASHADAAAAASAAATNAATNAPVTSTPSPRPDCTAQHVTIYFTDVVQSDQPVATPLLDLMMNNVRACEHAGGTVRSATIATAADPGQSADAATAQVRRRQDRVRDTLVHLGIASSKIGYAPLQPGGSDAVMSKHAEITVDLY